MGDIQINITMNSRFECTKMTLSINRTEPMTEILKKAATELDMDEVQILYNENGEIIEGPSKINDGETLYASQGEKFLPRNKVKGAIAPDNNISKIFKLGIIGPPCVGKSALTVRYTQNTFIEEYLATHEDIYKKKTMIHNEQVEIEILDTSGLDKFAVMYSSWFKESDAFALVYAIDKISSFQALKLFHELLVAFRPGVKIPIIVVGNKADNEPYRQIKKEDGLKFAASINADFIESSAKNDINVAQIFEGLAGRLYAPEALYAPKPLYAPEPLCAQKYPATYEAEEKKCCCLLL